jgi:predicted  nucleic acid-binding Zn-ribbon protein
MTEKKDFLEKQKTLLKDWNRQIDDLKMKAKKAQVETSVKIENYIDDLRERLEEVRLKLEDVRHAADDNWEEVKSGVDNIWSGIKDAFERAKSRFS